MKIFLWSLGVSSQCPLDGIFIVHVSRTAVPSEGGNFTHPRNPLCDCHLKIPVMPGQERSGTLLAWASCGSMYFLSFVLFCFVLCKGISDQPSLLSSVHRAQIDL